MPIDGQRSKCGGKGNFGMFIERDKRICAAGIPSSQPDEDVPGSLQHYLLKDEVDALISDSILPPPKIKLLPPLRRPKPIDNRHAVFTNAYNLLHPTVKRKFETLADDLKNTVYTSYWNKVVGKGRDPVPMFPEGFDKFSTTYGKKTSYHGRLYDIIMPKNPLPDKTSRSRQAGVQTDRNYCAPPFDKDFTFGHRTNVDKRGRYGKCCVTDDRLLLGNANCSMVSSIQSNFQNTHQPQTGKVLAPNNNIGCVPEGYSFGLLKKPDNLPECLSACLINPARNEFKTCLKTLNTLRKVLKARFLPSFFDNFYLDLKYFDKEKTGWLPKNVVYNFCATKFIRFDPALIEPLLSMWLAFDGKNIEYKTFVRVLNYREPSLEMVKVPDIPDNCVDFKTTYTEMVKPNQKPDIYHMAGVPSGRYLDLDFPITPDGYCRADRTCLPHESDMKSCINPGVLTLLHINHRDMYTNREPTTVRRVFEAAYGKFTDKQFDIYWKTAKKDHSQGWVCYETFRRALEDMTKPSTLEEKTYKV